MVAGRRLWIREAVALGLDLLRRTVSFQRRLTLSLGQIHLFVCLSRHGFYFQLDSDSAPPFLFPEHKIESTWAASGRNDLTRRRGRSYDQVPIVSISELAEPLHVSISGGEMSHCTFEHEAATCSQNKEADSP